MADHDHHPIASIDWLKGWAILGVVTIHLISNLFNFISPYGQSFSVLVLIDQFFRFSVPIFVTVSGFALASKYRSSPFNLRGFYLRRITKIFPIYFFWLAVILLVVHLYPAWRGFSDSYPIWEVLLAGKAEYHLYFVPMIFQLYLIFPIILFLVRKFPIPTVLTSLVVQASFFWIMNNHIAWRDQNEYIFFGSWLFYFVLGIFFAEKGYKRSNADLIGKAAPILLLSGLLWLFTDSQSLLNLGLNVINATTFIRLPVIVYSSAFFLTLSLWSKYLRDHFPKVTKYLSWLGKNSFLIYLCHTLILRILFELASPEIDLTQLSLVSLITLAAIRFSPDRE